VRDSSGLSFHRDVGAGNAPLAWSGEPEQQGGIGERRQLRPQMQETKDGKLCFANPITQI
jgi:hypothetical protein